MADVFVDENSLKGIANAIRAKNGSSATYTPAEMVQAIQDLQIPDVSDLDATAADILYPKKAYTADGETEGTIQTKSASDVTVSGDTVSSPAGYYPNAVSKSVQSGSATTPATIIPANPTISVNNSTGLVTASVNETQAITPTISEGYVSAGTSGNVRASGSATSQLPTQSAATITPTQSQQTAVVAGKFTTGDVVVDPIPSEYIVPTGTKQITITQNGTTTEDVSAYANAQITANVPNTYAASDEGKVVSNGALVSQSSDTVTQNGTVDTTIINSLTVNVSGGGDEPIIPEPLKDVVFVDYDGEIVEQYTAQEFLALSALPANPSHTGLTAQGWNWTLADAKEYVRDNGCLVVGQNYTTSDGKTRVYLSLTDQTNFGGVGINIVMYGTVTLDWGDGSAAESKTGNGGYGSTWTHTYADNGDYVITIECASGSTCILGNPNVNRGFVEGGYTGRPVSSGLTAIEIGNGVAGVNRQCFEYCSNLQTISVPTTFTGIAPNSGFLPSPVRCFVIPSGVTSVSLGSAPHDFLPMPKSLTSVGTAVAGFSNYTMRAFTPFAGDWGATGLRLNRAEKVALPGTYTALGGGSISTMVFAMSLKYCRSITFPDTITEIKAQALSNYIGGIRELHFLSTTPPTVAATNSLSGIQSYTTIYVPYSADHSILEAYQTATNWATHASKMQEEPQ